MPSRESLLERMLKESATTEHPSPFPIERTPFFGGPWFHVGRRAVETLSDPARILEFMEQYAEHISGATGTDREAARQTANSVVGYCTGYVDDEQANIWFSTLDDIRHPVTGRQRPFLPDQKLESIYLLARPADAAMREYIGEYLPRNLLGMRIVPVPSENEETAAYEFLPRSGEWENARFSYLFLSGYLIALGSAMMKDIGRACALDLQYVAAKRQ